MRFDPSFSWGDIGALLAAIAFAGALYARHDERLAHHDVELARIDHEAQDAQREVREATAVSDAKRDQLRQEIKSDLAEINSKLDRLIERELDNRRK